MMMIGLLLSIFAATSAPAVDPALTAMQQLPVLDGRWEGEGWIRMGPGEPTKFVGEEFVERRLDGHVMVIEGRHLLPDRSQVVHHALAFVTWDATAKQYRFRSHVAGRGSGDHKGYMENGAFVWENESASGLVRFRITVKDDTWHEVGHVQRGDKWYPMFEMTLKRVVR